MSQKETGSPILEVRLFGPVKIAVCGEDITATVSKRAALLLAILALRDGKPIERWRLAGMLWPDSPDATALHNLRQTLAPLRNALGQAENFIAPCSPRSLFLQKSPDIFVDVWEFDRAIKECTPISLQKAINLYSDQLLAECEEPFVSQEREGRSAAFLTACDTVGQSLADQKLFSSAIVVLQRALSEDPFREPSCRAMMSALAKSGDTSGALDFCREFRNRLRKELNLDISQETRKLIRSIRTTTTEKGSVSHAKRLPVSLTRLVGRHQEISHIEAMLRRCRLVTLTGPGGVGKTRLSVAVASAVESHFKDGVRFVDFAPLHDSDSLLSTIASTLEIAEKAGQGLRETIADELRNQEILVILDNCEHLEPYVAETVEHLLTESARLHILATSRQSLGIAGEFVFAVPTLCAPEIVKKGRAQSESNRMRALLASEALCLFLDRSHLDASTVGLPELETAGAICRTLDGLPLAIELAAARTRLLSLKEIETKLSDRFALLTSANRAVPRHRTLEASIEWSWDLLSPDEQYVLMRLSAFRGGSTLESLRAITANVPETQLIDLVQSLVDRSLVIAARGALESRFVLLETIRQYCEQKLSESGELSAVFDLHRDYFLNLAENADNLTGTEQESEVFEKFEREHDNFRRATSWCRERNHGEKQLRMACALSRFRTTQGHMTEGRDQIEASLLVASSTTPLGLLAGGHILAGWNATVQRDCEVAVDHFQQALAIFRELDDQTGIAKSYICMGCAFVTGRRYDEAQEAFEASLQNILSRNRLNGVAMLLSNLAEVALLRNKNDEARNYLDRVFNGSCETPSDIYEVYGEANLHMGVLNYREGNYEDALKHTQESLRLFQTGKRSVDIPGPLHLIALTLLASENWRAAAILLGAAKGLADCYGAVLRETLVDTEAGALASLKRALGPSAFNRAYDEGRVMDVSSAVEFAIKSGEQLSIAQGSESRAFEGARLI